MILFIEPNLTIRKRVCDLLPRERILGVGTYNETLEMIAKFRTEGDTVTQKPDQRDHEHMYKDLKKKYDLLVKYIKQLDKTAKKKRQ